VAAASLGGLDRRQNRFLRHEYGSGRWFRISAKPEVTAAKTDLSKNVILTILWDLNCKLMDTFRLKMEHNCLEINM